MRNKKNWFSDFLGKSTRHLFPPKAPPTLFQDDQPVHQLWPPEDVVQSTNCDVVLFHGTQRPGEMQPWKTTWVTRNDPHDCWVQTWLPQDLSEVNVHVRVLALSYDSCALQCGNQGNTDDVSEIARNILQILVSSSTWNVGQRCGFIMIGHCFGGLVIKSLMEEAYKRAHSTPRNGLDRSVATSANNFLKNLKGVAFYAVPHTGSELESYYTQFSSTSSADGVKWAGFMKNLKPHDSRMEDLSNSFEKITSELFTNVFAFLESTTIKGVGFKLVEKPGARRSARDNYYTLEGCHHFDVCKPPSKQHPSYSKLLDFIKICVQEGQPISIRRPGWQFRFFVEPKEVMQKLLEGLKEEGLQYIILHGNFGCGKTAVVEYVLFQRHAKDLHGHFPGGIFQVEYGSDCNNILAAQKRLLRVLRPEDCKIHGFKYLSIEDVQPSIQKELDSLRGPWLLFIDDVWNERSIHQSPLPSDKLCKVVITSRFELHDLPAIRIKIDESSNTDIATRLLASKAANDPHQTRFPPGCEGIAKRLLEKCSGCLLAVKILGSILSEVPKTPKAWENVETEFKHYGYQNRFIPCDYKSDGLYAAITMSLYYGQGKPYYVGMENVLRAISLFSWDVPATVVEVIWRCLQPPGLVDCFNMVVRDLITKGLVEETSSFVNGIFIRDLEINHLVRQFVAMKLEPIDLPTILVDEGGVKGRKEILSFFLVLYGRNQVRLATMVHSLPMIQIRHLFHVGSLDLASFMFLLICQAEMASPGICEYWSRYILAYLNHRSNFNLRDVDILSLKAKHVPDISVAPRTNMCKFMIHVIHIYFCKWVCERKAQHENTIWRNWMGNLLRASVSFDGYPMEQILRTTIEQILRTTPGFPELRETLRFL
ncbi:hypothetical protein BDL97_11G071500 [Sphagnum fallax]|nr:hypothetical protein BDL97_11G071500 [Sphagnum fallax]